MHKFGKPFMPLHERGTLSFHNQPPNPRYLPGHGKGHGTRRKEYGTETRFDSRYPISLCETPPPPASQTVSKSVHPEVPTSIPSLDGIPPPPACGTCGHIPPPPPPWAGMTGEGDHVTDRLFPSRNQNRSPSLEEMHALECRRVQPAAVNPANANCGQLWGKGGIL